MQWLAANLQVGDEIVVRIVDAGRHEEDADPGLWEAEPATEAATPDRA